MTKPVLLHELNDTDLSTAEVARGLGLNDEEYAASQRLLERVPNKVEIGIFSAMWNEHCSYKSSKIHLSRLPSTGENVIVGPGENAGVVDIGDGLGVCFKVESHNHPSFIEPFQGAATGVGGILRDVFTMGARPVALGNLLRFGEAGHPKTGRLLDGVVRGIAHYGNCFGAPTVVSDVAFDSCYNGNILVNALAVGLVRTDRIFLGRAEGVGNPIFYAGAKTGRDGIGGATMASDAFSDKKELERPTVQVGDPFMEKLLLEACLECFETDALVGIQDMGAAGLTSSSFEMASRTGAGVRIDLDAVPTRETGMSAYEIMLSESQERMLLVAEKGREDEVTSTFAKWELDCVQIGEVTEDGHVELWHSGQQVARIPARPLADEAPRYDRPRKPAPPTVDADSRVEESGKRTTAPGIITWLASEPSLAPRDFVMRQFDREVGVRTVMDTTSAPAALVRTAPGSEKALGVSMVARDDLCALDPREGARRTVFEAALRIACVGAEPLAVSDCLNHGNPTDPVQMQSFSDVVDGIADACNVLGVPVVSGNVSLYNETDGRSIAPTPTIAMVGLNRDVRPLSDVAPEDVLVRLGHIPDAYGGDFALRPHGDPVGPVSVWNADEVRALVALTRELVADGLLKRAFPVVKGGMIRTCGELFESIPHGIIVDHQTNTAFFSESTPQVFGVMRAADVRKTVDERCGDIPLTTAGTVTADHRFRAFYRVKILDLTEHRQRAGELWQELADGESAPPSNERLP